MQLTEKHRQYWNRNLKITAVLLSIWFLVTFVIGVFRDPVGRDQFLRLAAVVLHGGAGITHHLRGDPVLLRQEDAPA